MIQNKPKTCKGKGLAEDYEACSNETFWIEKDTGLCSSCQYNWMKKTENGKIYERTVFKPKTDKKTKQRNKEAFKKLKEKAKDHVYYAKKLQVEINTIIRLIDKGSGCISCKGHTTPQAGHYHSRGANSTLRFHLDNIHLQDNNCNNHKSANIPKYDLGLIDRYGKEYWNYVKFDLVANYPYLKLHATEYPPIISKAKEIIKELKAADTIYRPAERLELRCKYTKILGIYS